MHRHLILPLLGVVIGASATAPTAPASTTAFATSSISRPQADARPTGFETPRFGAEGIRTVSANPEGATGPQGMAAAPGCAQSAPLFRSHMPRLVAWQPGAPAAWKLQNVAQVKGRPEGPTGRQGRPQAGRQQAERQQAGRAQPGHQAEAEAQVEDPATAPAMHQALHLCVVDRFSPSQPLGGASRALYRL